MHNVGSLLMLHGYVMHVRIPGLCGMPQGCVGNSLCSVQSCTNILCVAYKHVHIILLLIQLHKYSCNCSHSNCMHDL